MAGRHNDEIQSQIQYRLTEELVTAKKRYQDFAENVRDVVFECDKLGRLTYVNRAWELILGRTAGESIGRPLSDFIDENDGAALEVRLGRGQEVRICLDDSRERWLELSFWPNAPEGYVGLFHDVTERKEAQRTLLEQHRQLEHEHANLLTVFETVPVAMLIIDRDWQVVRHNAAAARLLKHSTSNSFCRRPGDVLACSRARDTSPQDRDATCKDCVIRKAIERVLDADVEVRDVETSMRLLGEDGEREMHFAVSASSLNLDGQRHVLLAIADISERKRTEVELRESERRLSLVIEGTGVGMWDWDIQSGQTIFNERWAEILGYSLEELEPISIDTWLDLAHAEDLKRSEILIEQHFAGELDRYDCECRMKHKNGHWVWVHDRGKVVEWASDGKPLRMTGTHSDITERKRIEARLRESEHNYRSFFETIDDMIFIGDLTGGITWANAAAIGKLGYSSEELCSMDILDLHRPADRETAQQILEEMLRRERQYCPLPLLSKDGRPVPSESRVWMGTWNHEPAIYGVCKDLSAQQAALDMFEKVFEANPTPMALSCFPDRSFKAVNRAFCDLTGYQKCEVIGKTSTDFKLFANESEQQQVTNQLEREGRIQGMALAVRTKAGELRDGLFFGEIVESQGERFFLTAMVDITTQKQVESELRETQERLEQRVLTRTAELQNVNDALLTENTARRHTEATLEEHRQRLRHLASQLTLAEEQERHELAVQLHDTIGQELAMARLRLEHLRSGVVPEYARHLEVASGLLEDAVGHVHVLTHELGATVLYELGLPAALRSLGSHVSEQYDLAFSYHQTGEYRRLRKDLEVQLFRAARELVYNVLKHAQASQIDVSLEIDLGVLAVTVADDGCGFNSEASEPEASSHRSGFGLFSIRERLVTLGGRLELASKAGQGTSASVIVPISHDADEAANQEPMP